MEYHEIGERFNYEGVVLEVMEYHDKPMPCSGCYFLHFHDEDYNCEKSLCRRDERKDKKDVIYRFVEKCKPNDIEQEKPKENNNMKKQIYYADLTPCDNMQDYKETAFVPQFVLDDTKEFDTKPPIGVVQLATHFGWCIVAKWYNNGSTRIYGGTADAIRAGVSILGGCCDSGDCGYAFGEEKIFSKKVSEKDISVFDGYTTEILLRMEKKTEFERIQEERDKIIQKTDFIIEGTGKVFATQVTNIQSDEEIYGSLLDKLFTTYKAKDADYWSAFAEMFDELGIDYAYGKLREKMNRIKVLRKKPNMVENEGLEDALLDTAGYAILTLVELKKRKR